VVNRPDTNNLPEFACNKDYHEEDDFADNGTDVTVRRCVLDGTTGIDPAQQSRGAAGGLKFRVVQTPK
jgi:hypothetical protein